MMIYKCRVCNNNFFDEPLLQYKNMPKSAQYLPDINSLNYDNGITLNIQQCSTCGLVQLSNDPVHYYKEVIRASVVSQEMKEFRTIQFKKFIEKYSLKNKKIIEIGCGCGEYLSILNQFNVDAYGIEYSKQSIKTCEDQGLKVIDTSTSPSSFNAFFILSFLEHLPNPNSMLQIIHNNLTDDGVGIIEVPNFDMILQNNLFSEFVTDHLMYFTKETLIFTLQMNGFEILECNIIWHDYIISAVVKKRKKLNLSHFLQYQIKLEVEINNYINQFKEVGVWGAGHQSFAILSLMKLNNKIKYVIDSAPFKQGKYTPATHIPIVTPDTLITDSVNAIIVIAGSYSDEVEKIIKEKYDKNINVSILRNSTLVKMK